MSEYAHRPKAKSVAEAPARKATPAKKAAPTFTPRRNVPARTQTAEAVAERSDNATYVAMNFKLKLLASEIYVAADRLRAGLALANPTRVGDAEGRIQRIGSRLDDMAYETALQLRTLGTLKGEPRLTDGGLALDAALVELDSVVVEIDNWMAEHKRAPLGPFSLTTARHGKEIVALVFPNVLPAPRPLTPFEKSGSVHEYSIDAHLDAAIVAAESIEYGSVHYADRIGVHAKELAALLSGHPRIEGRLAPRIQRLVALVEQIIVKNPFLKRELHEAIDPIRNVK